MSAVCCSVSAVCFVLLSTHLTCCNVVLSSHAISCDKLRKRPLCVLYYCL